MNKKVNSHPRKKTIKPLRAKPLVEVTKSTEPDTHEDIYLVQGNVKHQFSSQISGLYGTKEYFWKGKLTPHEEIKFCHNDGRNIPVHGAYNCGYTLVGKAKNFFEAKKALCTNGEPSDDQEYVYVTQYSELYYVGDTEEHTVFLRIYDNNQGNDNDRWVVLYID